MGFPRWIMFSSLRFLDNGIRRRYQDFLAKITYRYFEATLQLVLILIY